MSLKEKSATTMDNAFPKPTLMPQMYGFNYYVQIFFDIIIPKVKIIIYAAAYTHWPVKEKRNVKLN